MNAGIQLRLSRLFNAETGKSVIIAVDHGIEGVPKGLEDPRAKVKELIEAGVDALLVNPGLFQRTCGFWQRKGAPGVVLAADYFLGATVPGREIKEEDYRRILEVEDAVRLGADAIKLVLVFGQRNLELYARNLESVAAQIQRAHRFGMPVMLETVLWGITSTDEEKQSVDVLRHMVRIAVELGADILKVPILGTQEELAEIVRWTPVPITFLGGQTRPDFSGVVEGVARALRTGASGIVFGRNVWQRPDLKAAVKALQDAVHGSSGQEQ
jgi:class I fructose-bisphosphate aldolase